MVHYPAGPSPGKASSCTPTGPGLTFRGLRRQRPPPSAPASTPSCPGAPTWGWLRPGTNGRRGEIGEGRGEAHWSLQLPITSSPTSAGHFLSCPGLRRLLGDRARGWILEYLPEGLPSWNSRTGICQAPPSTYCPQSLKFSGSGANGQVTGQAEDARVQIRKNGVGQWFSNLAGHCGFKTAKPNSKTIKSEV